MKMTIMNKKTMLCPCCMNEHEVQTVSVKETASFKDRRVSYDAVYNYCDLADELFEDEKQLQENDMKLKDAYRAKEGLLTSKEIAGIRKKYAISQNDMCSLLGWGGKTITRYESHQIQDKAHDTILRKIEADPEWFISLLNEARDSFPVDTYQKYLDQATDLYMEEQDMYLRKAIEAKYVKYSGLSEANGNTKLSLDKVVDVIRYFSSSSKVTNLFKVKLMKLMWYADALSYKNRASTITGLVYQALPMGAVPVGHDSIIDLKGVPCEEVDIGETNAYHFELKGKPRFKYLTKEDISILDEVIDKLGKMSKDEIVSFMHQEEAYKATAPRDIIDFRYAENLKL